MATHDISDRDDFEQALSALLQRAYENTVTVDGALKCEIDGNGSEYWDVQITRVAYADGDGEQ